MQIRINQQPSISINRIILDVGHDYIFVLESKVFKSISSLEPVTYTPDKNDAACQCQENDKFYVIITYLVTLVMKIHL
jgi:hypothetical protein